MPTAALHPCLMPRCPELVASGYCRRHARDQEGQRPNLEIRKLYHTARWFRLRAVVLNRDPLCQACKAQHRVTIATDVDHIVPHQGDRARFWDRANLQGLCHACHTAKTSRGA